MKNSSGSNNEVTKTNEKEKFDEEDDDKVAPPNYLRILLSHFSLIIVAVLVFSTILLTVNYVIIGHIKSSDRKEPQDDSKCPFSISHITDVHFSLAFEERGKEEKEILKYISEKIDPLVVVNTGDLIGNFVKNKFTQFYRQYKENWVFYNESIAETKLTENRYYIVTPGNHDQMDVSDFDSPNNNWRDFISDNKTHLHFSKLEVDTDLGKYNIILFNPIEYPFPSALLGMMPFCNTGFLDVIEGMSDDSIPTIYGSHYPLFFLRTRKSSRGRSITDITDDGILYLSGHLHPSEVELARDTTDKLHVVMTALNNYNYSGLVFIDNGAINYYSILPEEEQKIFITYPQIEEQISAKSVFNENSFSIRVVTLEKFDKLFIDLDGKRVGEMEYKKQVTGSKVQHFYTFNIKVEDGDHELLVSDESQENSQQINFFVGEQTPLTIEKQSKVHIPIFYLVATPMLLAFFLIILLPIWRPFSHYLAIFDDYIVDADVSLPWWKAFLISLIYPLCRMRKVPVFLRIVLAINIIYIGIGPLWLSKIDNKAICVVISWGCFIDGERYEYVVQFWLMILYLVVLSNLSYGYLGVFYETRNLTIIHYIEIGFFAIGYAIGFVAWVIAVITTGGAFSVFASPLTYVIIIFPIVIGYLSIRERRRVQIIDEVSVFP